MFTNMRIIQNNHITLKTSYPNCFQMGLNLENSIDFSDTKVKTCIRMSQPVIKVSQTTESKWISTRKVTSKMTKVINGRTLFLNDKNNELCNLMYPK